MAAHFSSVTAATAVRVSLSSSSSLRFSAALSHTLPRSLSGVAVLAQRRWQSSDQFHRYLHNTHVTQPDGVDGLVRTKADQQAWLNTEQWSGYSETYLQRPMQYLATNEHHNAAITPRQPILNACLALVYELYGTLADDLQELHDDPLHPRFHQRIARIKEDREKIAAALDGCYGGLHPTVKTIYDAYLVRRYYHLGDWITHVERKRAHLLERLSPELMAQVQSARGVSETFIERLRLLETAFNRDPVFGLLTGSELSQYTEEEMVVLRQKAAYFRHMRRFGANAQDSDIHTH